MSRPNLDNIALKPGEREELEQLFAYTEKFRQDIKGNPELARQFLQRIGYFEMMQDQQEEEEAAPNGASSGGAHTNGDSSS